MQSIKLAPKKHPKVGYQWMSRFHRRWFRFVPAGWVSQHTTKTTIVLPERRFNLKFMWHTLSLLSLSELNLIQDDEQVIVEARVRYLSFLGIGKNVKNCAFIVHTAQDKFVAHCFRCEPSSGALCKTIEAACKVFMASSLCILDSFLLTSNFFFPFFVLLSFFCCSLQLRYQKCLDAHPANSRTSTDSQSPNSKSIGETLKNIMNTLTFKKDGSTSWKFNRSF